MEDIRLVMLEKRRRSSGACGHTIVPHTEQTSGGEDYCEEATKKQQGESKAARDYEIDGGSATRCRGAAESCETKYPYQILANSN